MDTRSQPTAPRHDGRPGGELHPPAVGQPRRSNRRRHAAVLVKVAILMPVLIGMLGLVLDGGLLLLTHRQVRNAADAAALAAAMDLVRGKTQADALATANTFVQQYNGLATAVALQSGTSFNVPPASGAYAGASNYVEVIVTYRVQTLFIQVLGASRDRDVKARAVAGFEAVAAGEGVMVLDRTAAPGLRTSSNNATLKVNGRIVVNSEAAVAASAGTGGIYGTEIAVVGGVSSTTNFRPYVTGDPSPLRLGVLPEPDPLINLPTPATANGVDPTLRGSIDVTNNAVKTTPAGSKNSNNGLVAPNFVATGGEVLGTGLPNAQAGQIILYPGIYQSISVSGTSNVLFMPGIYVIATNNSTEGFKVTGGTITGYGMLIYSTGADYNPTTGQPDAADREQAPLTTSFGGISINASIQLAPVDTKKYTYTTLRNYSGKQVSDAFDGMLFYQRRRNATQVTITGNAAQGGLTGTLYSKWGLFNITGQGTYDAQFIVGSMDITGQGNVTIQGGGKARGRANEVFLVE